ncbi:MAG: methyltransferase domain-containing protein [Deltaproteobacteria bacterium]|nr:methyltransferase domain-containing protein [Deltaproteobacteria bacterium]
MRCQVCFSDKLYRFLDLGNHPPCIFLNEAQFNAEMSYPLHCHYCSACGLVQLGHLVDPKVLFTDDYHHIAALSESFKAHMRSLAAESAKKFQLTSNDLVVEIGSNDGALLEAFLPYKVKILGVDPSDVAKIALEKGLPTVREFFDEKLAINIAREHGQATLIAALNTFAHVSALDSFLRGIRHLLTDSGVFVSESHYVLNLISELQYDFIYHEHSRYYSMRHLIDLLGRFEMDVFDVERIPTHSGSIRVYACKKGVYPISKSVSSLLQQEEDFGLSNAETYRKFAARVEKHRRSLLDLLHGIRAEGQRIMGLTFPARAVTLLNFCQIGPDILECITERSSLKIGRFSPGTHIKVVDEAVLFGSNQPDYGLLLSWHIQKEIIPKFRAKGFKGKFIVPLPAPTIVE